MQKIQKGRNDLCTCGSGLKYKKCCLLRDDQTVNPNVSKKTVLDAFESNGKGAPAMMTTTNEPFMPIRLYYTILDKKAFLEQLHALKCVDFESKKHFLISYWKEAGALSLSVKPTYVPKNLYPIIIAHGYIVRENQLHLDLRSFTRGVEMIKWINAHIRSTDLKLTHVASYNVITMVNAENFDTVMSQNYDELFAAPHMVIIDPQKKIKELKAAVAQGKNNDERMQIATQLLDAIGEEDFARIEKYPVHYYEDGIGSMEHGLNLRMTVAIEHWKGNTTCKPIHIIKKGLELD